MKYVRKRVGSLSPSSSDNQTTGCPQLAIHSLTNVVLPKPAEAEMRVNLQPEQRPRLAARSGGGAGQLLAEVGGYKVSWLKLAKT